MSNAETPWGLADSERQIAPGITWYSTPSHGGYHLSPERIATLPRPLRTFRPFAGPGWFEEDEDWAVPVLAFPQLFERGAVWAAVRVVRAPRNSENRRGWIEVREWLASDAGIRVRGIAEGYELEHLELWERGSLWTLGVKRPGYGVSFTRPRDGARRAAILPDYPDRLWYTTAELDALPAAS